MQIDRRRGWPPPKKSLGQALLVDGDMAREIVIKSGYGQDCRVLEIGPGRGILTGFLLNTRAETVCCEIDKRMADLLTNRFGGKANFRLIIGDIMELSVEDAFPAGDFHILGNLPYHLTSEILFKFFDYIRQSWHENKPPRLLSMTVMVQKEVAERILSKPGSREWGILSIQTSLFAVTERLLEVPPSCFNPRPQVDSTVIKLNFRREAPFKISDFSLFTNILKAAFSARRKMLRNTLKQYEPFDETVIDLQKRPEELSAEDFGRLAEAILYSKTQL